MNICLVGDFSRDFDEGYKNLAYYLADGLEKRHKVTRLNVKKIGAKSFWNGLRRSKTHVIHLIAQPTDQSLVFARLFKWRWIGAKLVISALRPEAYFRRGKASQIQKFLIKFCKANLILVQSDDSEAIFRNLGCQTKRLPNGVNLERFRPTTRSHKKELRQRYSLDPHQPLVLHVGHLQATRNLMLLKPLIEDGIRVVVAGSFYMGIDHGLIDQLEKAGFYLLKGYQPNIEEVYMLADCYVFPLKPGNSLSMPLSVLEAMACNLPVVATRFSGLTNALEEGRGFWFADGSEELLSKIREALRSPDKPETRRMVERYSWEAVVEQLEGYYQELLEH